MRSLFDDLQDSIPTDVLDLLAADEQRAIPAIAKDPTLVEQIEAAIGGLRTEHRIHVGDSRGLDFVPDESLHLVVTSPPYWTLKEYLPHEAQLGAVVDYEEFLDQLDRVWSHCLRVLVPGGRLVVVVGDVCLSRRQYGRHVVFPLHASIQERCRQLGFDNLAPIIWHKIANARLEVDNGSSFLGKPYEPGAVIKNDIEYVLFQRKPGGYRSPTMSARALSVIPEDRHREWFQQVWQGLTGASTRQHPAPYPLALAERLIRMFSFVGDTVMDPFMGTGTTNLAAAMWGRNSVGVELHDEYFEMAWKRLGDHAGDLAPFMSPKKKEPKSSGLGLCDALADMARPTLVDYCAAAAEYIRSASTATASQQKVAQVQLSNALGVVTLADLRDRLGIPMSSAHAGEREVGGGLRNVQADVSEMSHTNGLTLAVEIKPVHLAVGRAIWNRFGDIRTFAVNVHLKFPFAVIGGIMTLPTEERFVSRDDERWKSTTTLIERAVDRFSRAGSRKTEAEAAHLLEGIAVVAFDHRTGEIDHELPPSGKGLRWDEFIDAIASAYDARFGEL